MVSHALLKYIFVNLFTSTGDTALHLAIKQQKVNCMHALLVLGADPTVRNNDGLDANDIALDVLGTTLQALRLESEVCVCNEDVCALSLCCTVLCDIIFYLMS